ncbi:MAG: uracil phosphoribosyltransferase [Acidimicrobiales bacterium]
MPTTVIEHPLVAARLATLREVDTDRAVFRRVMHELSLCVVYEACRSLPTAPIEVQTPLAKADGVVLADQPLLVPVLRAGLGMLAAAQQLLPDAQVGFVGLRRDELTLLPDAYVTTVPERLEGRRVLVLDPMLATGGSLLHTARLVRECGAGPITVACVLAAPEGIAAVADAGFADADIYTAALDRRLNNVGFIVPGLGDAGDRQFG